jgi:hypothetical protein
MASLGKTERRSIFRIGGWVGALGLMLAAMALEPLIGETGATVLILIAGALGVAACTAWFLGLDEMAQRAHYVAWFWGSSLGLVIAAAIMAIGALTGATDNLHEIVRRLFGHDDVGDGMMAGMLIIVVPMMLGYALWWAAFWLRRR